MSNQLPNPPELQPINSTATQLWKILSAVLTVSGITLMGIGGWFFVQQQIEANQPPPARILEVSVEDLEPAEATQPKTSILESSAPLEQVTNTNAEAAEPVELPAFEGNQKQEKEFVVEATSAVDEDESPLEPALADSALAAESKFEEETVLAGEVARKAEQTALEQSLSLADNPLPVVIEQESDPAGNGEVIASDAAGRPLTRIVAESIDLDSEVVEVGWQELEQDGVTTNVWTVADYAAGWHKNSALPGQGGNIVLSAHHNIKGEVFRYTVDLQPGDIVTLYDDTQSYNYVVEDKFIVKDRGESEAVRQENAKWIGPFAEERLTLVTCWPYNTNTHRLIVITKPVDQTEAPTE